jgi:hypothetical protein
MATISTMLKGEIEAILVEAETGALVPAIKSLFETLRRAGLMYEIKLQPRMVGCHPSNRDGYGINPHDVHSLLFDIYGIGFSLDELKAVCVEIGDDHSIVEWNLEMVLESHGMLAPVIAAFLKYASLMGGHTNQGFRALSHGCLSDNEEMTLGGKLSIEKIKDRDPALAMAAVHGVTWQVITSATVAAFPRMCGLVQAAGNAAGQIAKGEHELQVLRKLHNTYVLEQKRCAQVAFADVKLTVMRSKPPCVQSIPGMYQFMLKYSGGAAGAMIRETEAFVKANAPSSRTVSPEIWDAIVCDFKGPEQAARFRHGLLKLMYTDVGCKVTVGDIKKCGSKDVLPKVVIAESLMNELRQVVETYGISAINARDALGALDLHLAGFVIDKYTKVGSMSQIAHQCILELRIKTGLGVLASPWEAEAMKHQEAKESLEPTKKKGTSTTSELVMRNLTADGKLHQPCLVVQEMGFAVAMCVQRKADKMVAHIEKMSSDGIVLLTEDGQVIAPIASFIKGEWKPYSAQPDPVEIESWQLYSPHVSKEFACFRMKAVIMEELCELTHKYKDVNASLKVFVKPKKFVVSTDKFAIGKLILVPSTLKVESGSGSMASNAVDLGMISEQRFWLSPTVNMPLRAGAVPAFIAPFWFIETSSEMKEANMEFTHFSKKLGGGSESKFTVPVLKNTKAIKDGDRLCFYVQKVMPRVEELTRLGEASAKKARKSK